MRAFLNLISNSFYAATKRKTESAESDFEANLTVSTKNLGSAVEVRIRDNGNSIPAVAQEKDVQTRSSRPSQPAKERALVFR